MSEHFQRHSGALVASAAGMLLDPFTSGFWIGSLREPSGTTDTRI